MDLVSIITPLYNSENFILQTAESVIAQTYTNWEWIIVDDCSTDTSLQLVRNLSAKDPRIKVIQNERNLKTAKTRNRGIESAKGRYIAFIDSDDIWMKDKLEKQISFMKARGIYFSYHPYKKFYDVRGLIGETLIVPERASYDDILKTCSIGTLSAIYDQSFLGKVFMGSIEKREDLVCWLTILKKIEFGYRINEPLALYRIHKESYSANKYEVARIQWRVYREFAEFNILKSVIYFLFYSLHGYIKHKII